MHEKTVYQEDQRARAGASEITQWLSGHNLCIAFLIKFELRVLRQLLNEKANSIFLKTLKTETNRHHILVLPCPWLNLQVPTNALIIQTEYFPSLEIEGRSNSTTRERYLFGAIALHYEISDENLLVGGRHVGHEGGAREERGLL